MVNDVDAEDDDHYDGEGCQVLSSMMIWYDMIWFDIWYDIWSMIWYDMVRYIWSIIWYDMICFDTYDMIWFDIYGYDMIWSMMTTTLNASRYGVRQSTTTAAKYEGTWANGLQVNFLFHFCYFHFSSFIIVIITWANGLQVHFPRTKVISNSLMWIIMISLRMDTAQKHTLMEEHTRWPNKTTKALENFGKHWEIVQNIGKCQEIMASFCKKCLCRWSWLAPGSVATRDASWLRSTHQVTHAYTHTMLQHTHTHSNSRRPIRGYSMLQYDTVCYMVL